MKKISFLFLCFILHSTLFAQLEKGDWLLDFKLKTHSELTVLAAERVFFNSENLQLKCGRFLSDGLVAGLRYSLIKEGNQRIAEPLGKSGYSIEEHEFGAFLRYYFGRKPEKRLLFIKGDLSWSYTNFQYTDFDNAFLKQLNFDVGMGLSLFKFPNAAIEMRVDYNLLDISGNAFSENAYFGQSRLIISTEFQIYLNREFKSKWAKEKVDFLQKGRKIISGNFEYNGINSGILTFRTNVNLNLAYGKFISKRWALGGTLPISLLFQGDRVNFDVAIGPFTRYYQPLTERLQVFGHLEVTTNFVGENHNRIRGFETGDWSITKDLQPTFGLGMNLFLNNDLSAFWLYKYTVEKDITRLNSHFWNASRSTLILDMGFAFWF